MEECTSPRAEETTDIKHQNNIALIYKARSPSCHQFPMGPGPDGPMGAMGAMEPHHMNGSLGGFKRTRLSS